ncbi:hypothetical protein DWB77_00267 [Streptomyces hundungensis]|uniref:STAS domain-containing protein n=1 Tax=Streptomyces hundungensis TaxID=1077946 RepID=A0A387HB19_9ACTN|nr:STAS domain-containing protein [Streptomyces hundungensis]AYG78160.1 hypothetical protein DWB77_00267 [Streptomyces hundungensis]
MPTPPLGLHLATVSTPDMVRIEITGNLDYQTADLLLEEVIAQLTARPGLCDLHLHCGQLRFVDSMGLSAFLLIHRRVSASGILLHLDERPPSLNRLLNITGTFEHLSTPASPAVRNIMKTGAMDERAATHPPSAEEACAAEVACRRSPQNGSTALPNSQIPEARPTRSQDTAR